MERFDFQESPLESTNTKENKNTKYKIPQIICIHKNTPFEINNK